MKRFTSIEICAGAGGQAIGLERSGFDHLALVEIDKDACRTLIGNRPQWNVIEGDLRTFSAEPYSGVDLLAGGVPCPPFSIAGKQLGDADERDLFPEAIRIASECKPKAVMLENVKGLLSDKFADYRRHIVDSFAQLGLFGAWRLINSSDFGVPQLRPRAIFVALRPEYLDYFAWPQKSEYPAPSVGEVLFPEMSSLGWCEAEQWRMHASTIAPTLVGGSKRHGGPDLGPTRARKAWEQLGVDGRGVANQAPAADFVGMPRLTVKMASLIQGFPTNWNIHGGKTTSYRQVGNAFPPPVSEAFGAAIMSAFLMKQFFGRGTWMQQEQAQLLLTY